MTDQPAYVDVLSKNMGMKVILTEHMKPGTFMIGPADVLDLLAGLKKPEPPHPDDDDQQWLVRNRSETEAEFAGRWMRWSVRQGMEEKYGYMTWLNEQVGREPKVRYIETNWTRIAWEERLALDVGRINPKAFVSGTLT